MRMKVCICIGRLDDKEKGEEIFSSVIFNLPFYFIIILISFISSLFLYHLSLQEF